MKNFDKNNGSKIDLLPLIFLGILLSLTVKTFILDFYRVKGQSMEPAIGDKSVVAAIKTSYGLQNPLKPQLLIAWKKPKTGQIVLYMYQNYWVVKRCAATEGTPLECVDEDGSYFLLAGTRKIPLTSIQYHRLRTTKSVPDGYILAIGDNAELSRDSRDYGFVPIKNVVARVVRSIPSL